MPLVPPLLAVIQGGWWLWVEDLTRNSLISSSGGLIGRWWPPSLLPLLAAVVVEEEVKMGTALVPSDLVLPGEFKLALLLFDLQALHRPLLPELQIRERNISGEHFGWLGWYVGHRRIHRNFLCTLLQPPVGGPFFLPHGKILVGEGGICFSDEVAGSPGTRLRFCAFFKGSSVHKGRTWL